MNVRDESYRHLPRLYHASRSLQKEFQFGKPLFFAEDPIVDLFKKVDHTLGGKQLPTSTTAFFRKGTTRYERLFDRLSEFYPVSGRHKESRLPVNNNLLRPVTIEGNNGNPGKKR